MSNRIETGGGYVVRDLDDAGEPTDRFNYHGARILATYQSERAADAYIARMRERA